MLESGHSDAEDGSKRKWTFQAAAGVAMASMRFLSSARHTERLPETGIPPEDGPITHMQFSPDGKWLVTCGRHTSWIFQVDADVGESMKWSEAMLTMCVAQGGITMRQKLPRRKHLASNVQSAWSTSSETLVIMRSPRYSDQSKRVMIESWSLKKRRNVRGSSSRIYQLWSDRMYRDSSR